MSRSIGDDEFALRCCEITVGYVNGNTLLAFCAQTVSQQSKIDKVMTLLLTCFFNRFKLVFKNGFAVIKQSADQRTLAIVYASRSGETQQFHVEIAVFLFS